MAEPEMENPTTEGNQAVDWQSHIPSDMQEAGYWGPLRGKPLGDVLKSYGESQKFLGSSIRLPQDGDTEGMSKVYAKLGRPETPEGYQVGVPKIPDFEWDNERITNLKTVAHDAGLSSTQLQKLVDWYGQNTMNNIESHKQNFAKQAAETSIKLQNEWGINYDMNLAYAKKAGQHYFGDEGLAAIDSVAGNNESVIRGLSKLGSELAEDGVFGDEPHRFGGLSQQDAREKIQDVNLNKEHPYWHKGEVGYKEAQSEMENLFKIAYPDPR